jgi:hypothetical protein
MCLIGNPVPALVDRDANPLLLDANGALKVTLAGGGAPSGLIASEYVRSDKDVDFTGVLVQNAQATANLTGLSSSAGVISAITVLTQQSLSFEIALYSRDTFNTSGDMDTETWIDSITFSRGDGKQVAGAGSILYAASGLDIIYRDGDASTELHVGFINRDPTTKLAAGAGGNVVVQFSFRSDS